jgi:hypothetical protein
MTDQIGEGRKTVTSAGTAVPLSTDSVETTWVALTAETDNTGVVVAGGAGVVAAEATRKGTPLEVGDTYIIPADNLTDVYIDSTISGEGVTYTYGIPG